MKKERILIIKLGALGDFILSVSRMFWIKKQHPNASFTLMTGSLYVRIARCMGIFDSYIVDNRTSYWNLADKYRICKEVKAGDFDCVYDLQSVARTRARYFSVFRFLCRKPVRWIDTREWDERKVIPRCCGLPGKVERREVVKEPVERGHLEFMKANPELLKSLPHPYVLMIPGCSPTHPHKRWPAESFAALAERLAAKGIHTVVIGTKAEAAEVNRVAAASPMVLNLLGKTGIEDIPDLARHALASVGNDTGPSHMASHTSAPLIGLFAARKKPCSLKGEKTFNIISPGVIDLISVDEVWEALLPYISSQFK